MRIKNSSFFSKSDFNFIDNHEYNIKNPSDSLLVSVPSTVPVMHQLSRAPDSITLSWPQPDRPNGDILEYQLRYYDKARAHTQQTHHAIVLKS